MRNIPLNSFVAPLDIDCGPPPSIVNGMVESATTHYGSLAEYRCNEGYRLANGAERRLCLENATWSGSDPACVEVHCPEPLQGDDRLIIEVSNTDVSAFITALEKNKQTFRKYLYRYLRLEIE